jgi:hypothetical protein
MALPRSQKPPQQRLEASRGSLTPIAIVVALGIVMPIILNNIDRIPLPQLEGVRPALVKMLPGLQAAWLMQKTYDVNGRAWSLASLTPVTDFDENDMVPILLSGHHRIFANRSHGVLGLGGRPHGFDRLYLELRPHVYAALRWRDVP